MTNVYLLIVLHKVNFVHTAVQLSLIESVPIGFVDARYNYGYGATQSTKHYGLWWNYQGKKC